MLVSKLIDYSYVNSWADNLILRIDLTPIWLCDLSTKQNQNELIDSISKYINEDPFISKPNDLNECYVACLFMRYQRSEITWSTFLIESGSYIDSSESNWCCETFYDYHTKHSNSYFKNYSEKRTKNKLLDELPITKYVNFMEEKFKPFYKFRTHIKLDNE